MLILSRSRKIHSLRKNPPKDTHFVVWICKGHFTHEIEGMWPLHLKHYGWWKRRSRSKFASHYAWGTNGVRKCKTDVKSTWIHSYMASNGSCFTVTWITFKNHLLKVGLTQNQGDHGMPKIHDRWFIIVYHVWGPRMLRISSKQHLVGGPVTHDFTVHLRAHDHTPWFWTCLGMVFGHLFGLSQLHGHDCWLVCGVALSLTRCKTTNGPHGWCKVLIDFPTVWHSKWHGLHCNILKNTEVERSQLIATIFI